MPREVDGCIGGGYDRAVRGTFGWVLVTVALSAAPVSPVRADIYQWTDAEGVMHFTNVPRGDARYQLAIRSRTGAAGARAGARSGGDLVAARDNSPERFSRYDDHIREASRLYQIPEALIRAVIKVESDYDPRVVSSAGAEGLMQLMPDTARRMGVPDSFDPRHNILGGTRFLRILANLFSGDLVLTVAAYQAGESAVVRAGGIPASETTRRYVESVLRHYYAYRATGGATGGVGG